MLLNKSKVIQNKVGRMELGANRMIETEVLCGDTSRSSFEEIIFKGELKHKIMLDRMRGVRWVKRYI